MSHQPERKEKDCLNCGTLVQGRYCQNCGQENIVTHQNFLSLAKHFIYDIFHFDGKFFDTLRYLLFKPGFVAKEYVKGKRSKYLDPIRMYLFTSALFFLVLFSISHIDSNFQGVDKLAYLSNSDRKEMAEEYQKDLKKDSKDTLRKQKIDLLLDTTRPIRLSEVIIDVGVSVNDRRYYTAREYDSIQQLLPKAERDGWIEKALAKKKFEINEKYAGDERRFFKNVGYTFLHRFPYLLFVSLPFFAGLLKLLYIRRKAFYYSDHAVFTMYHYIFSFIILLMIIGSTQLEEWLNWDLFGWITFLLCISWFIYLYKGLRNFYEQSRGKTIVKLLLLNITGFILIIILFAAFFLFTAYQL
ncbi:MAG TPA: DUF3667 domain-containing protein [Flavisolibacter sp.]|nr:DUF3667 domain-containing protein [Flavisolibacter sp.]